MVSGFQAIAESLATGRPSILYGVDARVSTVGGMRGTQCLFQVWEGMGLSRPAMGRSLQIPGEWKVGGHPFGWCRQRSVCR